MGNGTRGNVLLVLTTFILFLLIFEHEVVLPSWLQSIGRMHPMFVHFPIVVVLIAVILETFRFRRASDHSAQFYSALTGNLLFAGCALAGITVIMGIFLSQEGGYNEQTLSWHKWSGVSVYFLSALIYSFRESTWFAINYARAAAIVTTIAIIVAGHQGGILTHGENYVWQPIASAAETENVPIDEALAFDHVIKPLFESRCRSCHNPQKRKGELLLTDSVSILRGGEDGAVLIAGLPDSSLLMRRIWLPLDQKEHMPPSDRPQLTAEEKDILYYWIKSGARFSSTVSALPETDSFRLVAMRMLESKQNPAEEYDFPAADADRLVRLNSKYRVIRPVAKNSPALTVNIYNRSLYSPTMLEELVDVKRQVVALDLSKMPVGDDDLRHVGRLENLQKLNLNFTGISGAGLAYLASLEDLELLSLSGTAVAYSDIRKLLSRHVKLKTLAAWETRLTADEIAALQNEFPNVEVLGAPEEGIALIKLNVPQLKNKSRIFEDSITPELVHPVRDTEIRFTTDGSDPDSVSSKRFDGSAVIRETTAIRAKAFKQGWLSSDIATLNVYRSSQRPDTALLLSKLNRVHVQKGAQTFFDFELGAFNANSPAWANNWGGVRNNNLELLLQYDVPAPISSISFNCLIETENSIFPPDVVEIWGGDTPENLQLIGRRSVERPTVYRKPYIELFDCRFETRKVSYVKIIAKPVMKLPGWHKNKGKTALLLIDEILVN